jgi:hypothetical protein|nr:MAG TPA: hypothetical protein [Caudoviricetes sp.]
MERKEENKIYSMPLLKNIGLQAVGKKGWKLTQCPVRYVGANVLKLLRQEC